MTTKISLQVYNDKIHLIQVQINEDSVDVSFTKAKESLASTFSIEDMRELARFILDNAHKDGVK